LVVKINFLVKYIVDMEELNFDLKETLTEVLEKRDAKKLREIFDIIPNIDIAEACEDINDPKQFIYIFKVVTKEYTSGFFSELSTEKQEIILNAFTDKDLVELLDNSFADDIVDTMEELPANLVNRILKVAPADLRKDINQLLNYKENTAGSVMTTEYIEMKTDVKVKDALKQIREKGKDAETIYTIFVRDAKRTLVGTIDLDDLIFSKDEQTLEEIMNRDFVTCNVNDDQEEVANMFKRYDLNAMAVVNNEDKLIGIITVDDVVDIIVEEANEDIAKLNNISDMEDPYLKTSVFKLYLKCVPWIIILMVLQVFSTMIMSGFEAALSNFIILSFFTAVICDAGGNSGGQTTTLIVRSLALGEFEKGDLKKVVWKEIRVALLVGGTVCLVGFGWLMFEMTVLGIGRSAFDTAAPGSAIATAIANLGSREAVMCVVAALVSLTLFVTIIVSRLIGCLLPFLAKLIKKDPAVLCGPMTTTIVDVCSLITYFLLWTFVFSPILGL